MPWQDLPTFIAICLSLIVALTIHEFAHAWTAVQFGDDTPVRDGRLTLNPLVHLDLLGTLMLLFAGFGWAKPVRINPLVLRQRSPAALMLVSAAGPLSNLLLALLAAIPFRAGLVQLSGPAGRLLPSLSTLLLTFVFLNLILLFLNLLPVAPLDGEKVLAYFLPPGGQETLHRLRPYGPMILIGLIVLGRFGRFDLLGLLIAEPASRLLRVLIT